MNILHVCCTSNDPFNGMVKVIPEHVVAQACYANVGLLNLNSYRYEISKDVLSLSGDDYKKMGFEGIIHKLGEIELVVFHGIYLPKLWLFYLKNVRGKYKYIVVPHGSMGIEAQKQSKLKKMFANRIVVYYFTKNANKVQFLSKTELDFADRRFYRDYIIQGNGIDEKSRFVEMPKDDNINIVYIGRIDNYHKGLDILLEACGIMRNYLERNNVRVSIYGNDYSGSKKVLLEKVKEYSLDKCVKIYAPISGKDKEDCLVKRTTYFIMPSRFEGQPMAALEALSYGIPIIMSDKTGFYDEVQKYNCGFVMKTEVNSIKTAIISACEKMIEYKKYSDNALKCAQKYYWNVVGRETIEQYEKI